MSYSEPASGAPPNKYWRRVPMYLIIHTVAEITLSHIVQLAGQLWWWGSKCPLSLPLPNLLCKNRCCSSNIVSRHISASIQHGTRQCDNHNRSRYKRCNNIVSYEILWIRI